MTPGDRYVEILTESLTRMQIIEYAAASGDFNPVHVDETFAKETAGFPSVFAHGMLTMGLTARALSAWVGDGFVERFGVRFSRQVWPGDRLMATLSVVGVADVEGRRVVDIDISTQNGDELVVLSGYARATLPAAPEAVA